MNEPHTHDWRLIETVFRHSAYLAQCTRCLVVIPQRVLVVPVLAAEGYVKRATKKQRRAAC